MVVAYYGVGVQSKISPIIGLVKLTDGRSRPLVDQIPPEDFRPMLKAVYSTRLLYVVGTMLVKMSLLTFYLRLDQLTRECPPFSRVILDTPSFIVRHPLRS